MTARLGASEVLSGRYQVDRVLGEGGMGAVYLARDLRLPRVWAIKEMGDSFSDPSERAEAVEAFETEAHLLSELEHPNLPRITDYFSEGGRQYLVMDFVEGETLEKIVDRRGRLAVGEALDLAVQITEVLQYLHSRPRPVIFRDLKPANVIVNPEGTAKLIDFGIARFFQTGKASDTRAMGTPGYAAPEQYGRGQSDARTDLYALGATLHHALSGVDPSVDPFRFEPLRTLNPEVPEQLEAVVQKALSLAPDERYQDALSFRRALEDLRHVPEAYPKLPERLRTGPLPAPPLNRFDPGRLDLGRHRKGDTVQGRALLLGPVQGRLKSSERWLRVTPGQVRGKDVAVEVTAYTSALANGGRFHADVLYEGAQGNERMGVELELEPVRVGCWTMGLAFLLTAGSLVPLAGLVSAFCLWMILLFTPSHERATVWPFTLVGSVASLLVSGVTVLVAPSVWEWLHLNVLGLMSS